jgi:hypothetical protein
MSSCVLPSIDRNHNIYSFQEYTEMKMRILKGKVSIHRPDSRGQRINYLNQN